MTRCTFCRIASGEEHAHRIYEDDRTLAFLDDRPAVEGHTLVAPKRHVEDLVSADERTATATFETTSAVASAMKRTFDPDGFSWFHSTGSLVGNVEHAHVHLLPRYEHDSIRLSLERRDLVEGDRIAAQLREEL